MTPLIEAACSIWGRAMLGWLLSTIVVLLILEPLVYLWWLNREERKLRKKDEAEKPAEISN